MEILVIYNDKKASFVIVEVVLIWLRWGTWTNRSPVSTEKIDLELTSSSHGYFDPILHNQPRSEKIGNPLDLFSKT